MPTGLRACERRSAVPSIFRTDWLRNRPARHHEFEFPEDERKTPSREHHRFRYRIGIRRVLHIKVFLEGDTDDETERRSGQAIPGAN